MNACTQRPPTSTNVRLLMVVTLAVWLGCGLAIGCRGIGRYGESRQSIAARRLSRQGLEAMHAGQWDLAEGLFADALKLTEDDDRAHWGLAESLWIRGERQAALSHMEDAVRLSAADPLLIGRLGKMYLELGRLEDAHRQSQLALQTDRHVPESWGLRGDCFLKSGDHDQALAAYHQALALRPDYPEVQLQLAELYRIQGRYDRLLATIDRLQDTMSADGCPCQAHLLRGVALQQLDRKSEAQRCFEEAIRVDPSNPDPYLYLASLMLEQGDRDAAQKPLQTAISLRPTSRQAIDLADRLRSLSAAQDGSGFTSETTRVAERFVPIESSAPSTIK